MIKLSDDQNRQLNAACFKIDHSCGLMNAEDMERLRSAGREWLNALIDAGLVELTGVPVNRTEGYREGLMAARSILLTHATIPGNQHLSDTLMAINGSLGTLLAEARQPVPEDATASSQHEGLSADVQVDPSADPERLSD